MPNRRSRYKQMERYMTYALLAVSALFLLYLLASGAGIAWLKVITAILAIICSCLCLAYLFLTRELLRSRSLWMTAWAGAILLCTLISLLTNFPRPAPELPQEASVFLRNIL